MDEDVVPECGVAIHMLVELGKAHLLAQEALEQQTIWIGIAVGRLLVSPRHEPCPAISFEHSRR